MRRNSIVAAVPVAFIASVALAGGDALPVEVVIAEGDAVAEDTVGVLNGVFATQSDTIGFNASLLKSGDRFVWLGEGPVVFNSDFKEVVTGAEAPTGVADDGNWIYSPAVDGNDSVILGSGLIVSESSPSFDGVPGFITFASRPFMTAGGIGYFVSGYNETDPKGGSQGRVFYRAEGSTVTAVAVSGDSFDYDGTTFTIDIGGGIDFDFDVSDDDSNRIQIVDAAGEPGTADNIVLINGVGVHREGDPNGSGNNWDNFDLLRIDNAGNYVMTGDTNGDTGVDEFIAVNGSIVIREGMMVDGIVLESGVTLRAIDLLADGTLVHAWGSTDFGEVVFIGNISDLVATSTRVVGTGDLLDLGGTIVTVEDLEASTSLPGGLAVSDSAIYANLSVDPGDGGAVYELIARIPRGDGPACIGDLNGNGEIDFDDLLNVLGYFGTDLPNGDANGDGFVDFDDLLLVLAGFGPCP